MKIEESNLEFVFEEDVKVLKFDETNYYNNYKNCMEGNKGVDILAYKDSKFVFIEIKNFEGYENEKENIRRLMTSNSETETLDKEISEKVRSTIAALVGGHIKGDEELEEYFISLTDNTFYKDGTTIDVILFIEGNIKKMVRKKGQKLETQIAFTNIRNKIKKQLKWLTDRVSVENIDLKREQRFFKVRKI